MIITTLVENTLAGTTTPMKPEHGISLLIEYNGKRILFDTGASGLFLQNAKKMNIDLSQVDYLIISHAHFDHAGGLKEFLEINTTAPVIISSLAHQAFYAKIFFFHKYIGINRSLLQEYPDRFNFLSSTQELLPGITVIFNTVNEEHKPSGNNVLLVKENGSYKKDPFDHELILVIDDRDGSVVFTGCSHNGILNMLASVFRHFPGKKIKAVIGGFHLMNPLTKKLSEHEKTVASIGAKLKSLPLGKIYTGHCTGSEAFRILKDELGDGLEEFKTGSVLSI
jgi:7,8-dihydropterin-6-yl-methyl-4-(beta-D-ribofuranosyl)aminobenzene 5'-phosphate synthase